MAREKEGHPLSLSAQPKKSPTIQGGKNTYLHFTLIEQKSNRFVCALSCALYQYLKKLYYCGIIARFANEGRWGERERTRERERGKIEREREREKERTTKEAQYDMKYDI